MKDLKTILYTIPNFDTAGGGKALLNIARRLDQNIFRSEICCNHTKGDYYKEVEKSQIPIHIQNTTLNMIPRINGLMNCIKLARYFRSLNVDLIHSFYYGPDYSEAFSARLAGIPWIYTKKNMNWGNNSKNGWKLRSIFSKHILVQNKDMIKKFFPKKKNVSLVPRGVNTNIFMQQEKCDELLLKHNIKANEKIIITVANLVPVKNIDFLLTTYEKICIEKDNTRLFIIGDKENEYGKELERKAKLSKFSDRISFTGKVQNISDYHSIADIFVLPSKKEGCPVSLLEAMSSGLPIAASKVPGVKDVLEPFPENMFPSNNMEKLKALIIRLLDNKSNGTKLRNHIINNYGIHREVFNHESIYKQCLNL